jgi:hypothetical protein
MGLLSKTSQESYNTPSGFLHGTYQFVSLQHIVSSFMFTYVGESKIINKVNRAEVQFHGMRAIQEFSYDIFRSVKSQEIEVPNTLKMLLPQDYVNYIKINISGSDGIERILYPTGKTSNPFAISQDANGAYQYDGDGNFVEQAESNTLANFKSHTNDYDVNTNNNYETDDDIIDAFGRRYGLDPQYAQQNGTFYIDYNRGYIHFGSSLAGKTIVLHYISDGLGTDTETVVHKFCEEAVYKWIACAVISSRSNVPEYIVQRFKKEKFAEARKAKIRLSNIKIEEFTQVLKGLSKPIK